MQASILVVSERSPTEVDGCSARICWHRPLRVELESAHTRVQRRLAEPFAEGWSPAAPAKAYKSAKQKKKSPLRQIAISTKVSTTMYYHEMRGPHLGVDGGEVTSWSALSPGGHAKLLKS